MMLMLSYIGGIRSWIDQIRLPSVRFPSRECSLTIYLEYWSMRQLKRSSKYWLLASFNHCLIFPSRSWRKPSVVKPCANSWPKIAPMEPKLIASGKVTSKNGGRKMPLGKKNWFMCGREWGNVSKGANVHLFVNNPQMLYLWKVK